MPKRKHINRELPPIGTMLHCKFKGKKYNAVIVSDEKKTFKKLIRFNGKNYSSMTAAAKAITKASVNGWRYWKYDAS